MDIRNYFSPGGNKAKNDDDDFVTIKKRRSNKRKGVLFDSESDEEPIPKTVKKELNSNIIANSDDEVKTKTFKNVKKNLKKTERVDKKLKETTPSEFFGSFKSEKRKKSPKSHKLHKQNTKPISLDDSDDDLLTNVKPSSLSSKLASLKHAEKENLNENNPNTAKFNCKTKPVTFENLKKDKDGSTALKEKRSDEDLQVAVGINGKLPAKITPEKVKKTTPEKFKNTIPKKVKKTPEKTKKKPTPKKNKKLTPKLEIKTQPVTPVNKKQVDSRNTEKPSTDKQTRFLKYQQWQSRAGPSAPGSKEVPKGQDNCFEGLTFVITGVQESLTRDEIKSLVERYGGKVTGAVSSRTSYLITGTDPGQSKLSKAEQHKTKVINEDEFLELIRTTPGKKSKYEVSEPKTTSKVKQERKINQKPEENQETKSPTASSSASDKSLMWVDKYKPVSIKQIIGQQGANSNVQKLLNWLKKWKQNNRSVDGKPKPKPKFSPWGGGDPSGTGFKAALLSGPPGVGKTTTATLVCKELGLPYIELNASDQRSKRILKEDIVASVQNTNIANMFGKDPLSNVGDEHVLIMDEVDGMAGNEDRGGIQELIQIIKSTKIPIICMCNDRSSPKIRSLVNYCFDLRFQRPRVEHITSAVMSICYKEGMEAQAPAVQAIIRGCNQDVRQVLHNLNMLKASNQSLSYDNAKVHANRAQKDVNLGIFEVAKKLLSIESASLSILDKSDLFFMDYSMVPKFIQENYLSVYPQKAKGSSKEHLKLLSKAADSIAFGDLIESSMRHDQSWSMLPTLGLLSTVLPCDYICGSMREMLNFPSFFGKLSTTGKNHRLLQELKFHSSIGTNGCTEGIMNLDIVPYLRWHLTQPLLRQSKSGSMEVPKVTKLLDSYDLTREDFDSLMEVGQFQGSVNYMSQVDSKVKSSFTRTYNKESHLTPYAVESTVSKKKKKSSTYEVGDGELDADQVEEIESDNDDVVADGMIKQSKKSSSQSSKPRAKKSKATTSGAGPAKKSRK